MKFPFIRKKLARHIVAEELDILHDRLYDRNVEPLMFVHDGCPVMDGKVLLSTIREEIERAALKIRERIGI